MPAKGEKVDYRSFAGETWDAEVVAVRDPGHVDLVLHGPGLGEGYELHAIRWTDDVDSALPGARPKRETA